MRMLRILMYVTFSFLLGCYLADCVKASAKIEGNEVVTLNSLNAIAFRGEVTEKSISLLQDSINAAVKARGTQKYPIYLVLDSGGGDVIAGVSFIEWAKTIPNLRTITIFAASMAANIVEGLPGTRLISGTGSIMFHRAQGQFEGQFSTGEVESRLAFISSIVNKVSQENADRMRITFLEYSARIQNEWWMYGKQAIEQKSADKVVDLVCSQELTDSHSTQTIVTFFGAAEVEYSDCPLFRFPSVSKNNVKSFLHL